ncbi:MAG: LamG-like jellyroll fold domain-containing protein [Ferruginibacter sp.]
MNKIAKQITYGAAALLILGGIVTSCNKSDDPAPPDPIGGFNNADEVGAASLKAHWTFDGTPNEAKSSLAPAANVGTSYGTGIKGQGLVLNNGFMRFPTIPNLSVANIGSMTVSCWVKVDNNGSTASNVFSLTQDVATQTDWNTGMVNMLLETGHPVLTDDTLVFHPSFSTYPTGPGVRIGGDNINDYGVREVDFKTVHGTNRWVHYVMRYDGTGSNIDAFADGILVSNNNFRHRETAPGVGVGPIVATTPTQVLIGGLPNVATGYPNSPTQVWQGLFTGSIDEIRFWSSALSDADISSLYQLEKVGR